MVKFILEVIAQKFLKKSQEEKFITLEELVQLGLKSKKGLKGDTFKV